MRKIVFAFVSVFSLAFIQTSFAQSKSSKGPTTPMQVGSTFLNIGVGPGGDYKGHGYGIPFGVKAAVEFGLWQAGPGVVTLGGELGGNVVNSSNYYGNNHSVSSGNFIIAARAAWHYGWDVPGLDTYGGVSAGVGFNHYTYYNNNDDEVTTTDPFPYFGVFAGASYFISPTFGFNAEFGYDITVFQVGVVFKLQ